jgi:hypothetical protein
MEAVAAAPRGRVWLNVRPKVGTLNAFIKHLHMLLALFDGHSL